MANYPSKADVRADVKHVLLSAHGKKPDTATRVEVSNAAKQYFDMKVGWFQDDRIAFRDYIITCIKDWLDRAKSFQYVGKSVTGGEVWRRH